MDRRNPRRRGPGVGGSLARVLSIGLRCVPEYLRWGRLPSAMEKHAVAHVTKVSWGIKEGGRRSRTEKEKFTIPLSFQFYWPTTHGWPKTRINWREISGRNLRQKIRSISLNSTQRKKTSGATSRTLVEAQSRTILL